MNKSQVREALQASFLPAIRRLHEQLRDDIVTACERAALAELSRVVGDEAGDTIYAIDRVGEERLIAFFERLAGSVGPLILIAEGVGSGHLVLPAGSRPAEARWRVIVDPIDGTRGLMVQKRSAWILTGVAPNRGAATTLQDIELAVQTEIPLLKQHLSDSLWSLKGRGVSAERYNRLTGARMRLALHPSRATSIAHGFAMIARFFPGARAELAAIDEEIVREVLGAPQPGRAQLFEDQYISSAGQLYELMAGHDRFVADLRPLMDRFLARQGEPLGICSHPYDLCTELIARELGVIVTGPAGEPLAASLAVTGDVAWAGYANQAIRDQVEPALQAALRRRGLLARPA